MVVLAIRLNQYVQHRANNAGLLPVGGLDGSVKWGGGCAFALVYYFVGRKMIRSSADRGLLKIFMVNTATAPTTL